MFDFDKYIKERSKITEEESTKYDWDKMDLKEINAADRICLDRINELNKLNRIIFIHELRNAWMAPKKGIYILDNDKDNIYIVDYKKKENNIYTINYNELQNVKDSISQFDDIFRKIKIPFPPVLDGTLHSVYISNFNKYRQIDCSNLWYFVKGNFTNGSLYSATKRQKEYTMELIKVISDIQKVLNDNNIDFNILID